MKQNVKRHVQTIIVCGILAAIGFVLDRFLGVTVPLFGIRSLSVNISYVPIFLAGFLYGPVWGALVGGVQDILCVILVPLGPFIPGITLSTMLAGAMAGFFKMIFLRNCTLDGDQTKTGTSGKSFSVFSIVAAFSTVASAILMFLPSICFSYADGTSTDLSAWQAFVETEEYRTVFVNILNSFDSGDSSAMIYKGIAVADLASVVSFGYVAAVIFGIVSVVSFFNRKTAPAVISAFAGFITGGLVSFTVILHFRKEGYPPVESAPSGLYGRLRSAFCRLRGSGHCAGSPAASRV